jgi:hypothetical protein
MSSLPAIVKAGTKAKAKGVFGLETENFQLTADAAGVRLGLAEVVRLSAKAEDADSAVLKPNARIIIRGTLIFPKRYTFLVTFNPDLLRFGSVSCPAFVSYKDLPNALQLGMVLTAGVDLSNLPWIFELRAID